ncbi:penicillin-binding protein [Bifidobacterium ramosum]|uniref:Penicillin-binding protein n=1 Tax=Bifidobacterium ramosum TaxID=1798158 RepID=A0A6L4X026_9BIFI|nr:penicillin-binding transpeptidase domain-containing protein [Bifidobacterium ramosum]KAB8286773.1 penicillin-binding protein [Bifidobacterium ramosum]NEG72742.1 penicillin-binding protein 2 [Bifidobacterium ramosum]
MNKSLRQLFTAVLVLFVILGLSTTIITAVRADELNADGRNARAIYHTYGVPRGSILASDGTVLAKSEASNDSFKYQRSYADGTVYAPVTGYYSVSQGAGPGIESSRNTLLNGESDALFWERFKSVLSGSENTGATIETSINPKLQSLAYKLLGDFDGAVVVNEPKTGRILAMASTPSYDPNTLATHNTADANKAYQQLVGDDANPMLNRTISQLYPPGSTFKTVVMAAALESGKYDLDTQIPAGATYTLPGTATDLINSSTAGAGTNGKISLQDALAYSSNTAFAQLGVALGADKINAMAEKFGYGSRITVDGTTSTGTPMTSVAAKFPSGESDDRIALASIGQGDNLTTPLQNLLIASAVANDGVLMKPTLVDRVRSSDLSVISETKSEVMSKTFSTSTADKLTTAMESVITKEYPELQIDGVKVAAKTGTAQIGSANQAIDGWIIGFAPADNPKVAVSVVVHNTDLYGSLVAGPIMKSLIEEALKQ